VTRNRCSQCDKELPLSWTGKDRENLDSVCPKCATGDLKKQSVRRRRILDTSVRKKANLDLKPQPATPAQAQPSATSAQGLGTSQVPPADLTRTSVRDPISMDIELDTDDPILLAAQEASAAAAEKVESVDPPEETTQIRKPKRPPGPQTRLNF
jgi:hypothetical protein